MTTAPTSIHHIASFITSIAAVQLELSKVLVGLMDWQSKFHELTSRYSSSTVPMRTPNQFSVQESLRLPQQSQQHDMMQRAHQQMQHVARDRDDAHRAYEQWRKACDDRDKEIERLHTMLNRNISDSKTANGKPA